jgi:ABC-type amino acid transport substrate-binding protein
MKNADGSWSGISIELWRHIADKLNLKTTFKEFATVPDLLAHATDGSVDVAISAITVTAERERVVDFTQPFFSTGLGIAVPEHREMEWLPILKSFLTLRFLQAVGILIGVAILVGTAIWLLERRHTDHYAGGRNGLGTGLWWTASAMTQAAAPDKAPGTLWGRALAMVWMIMSVVIIASFTAGTTAQLTRKDLLGRVRGEYDLGAVRTGTVASTSALDYLRNQRIYPAGFESAATGLAALKAGKLDAFVYDKPLLDWVVRRDFADELRVLPNIFDNQNYAIAVPPNSDMRTRIDLAMVDDLRTDWWKDLLVRYLGRD